MFMQRLTQPKVFSILHYCVCYLQKYNEGSGTKLVLLIHIEELIPGKLYDGFGRSQHRNTVNSLLSQFLKS